MTPKRDPPPPSPRARISTILPSSQKSPIRTHDNATEPQGDVRSPTTNNIVKFTTSSTLGHPYATHSGFLLFESKIVKTLAQVPARSPAPLLVLNPPVKHLRRRSPLRGYSEVKPSLASLLSSLKFQPSSTSNSPAHGTRTRVRHARSGETGCGCQTGLLNLYLVEVTHSLPKPRRRSSNHCGVNSPQAHKFVDVWCCSKAANPVRVNSPPRHPGEGILRQL